MDNINDGIEDILTKHAKEMAQRIEDPILNSYVVITEYVGRSRIDGRPVAEVNYVAGISPTPTQLIGLVKATEEVMLASHIEDAFCEEEH